MRAARLFLLAASAACTAGALPAASAAPARRPVGLVQRMEVMSLSRDRISVWLRAALANAPRGSRQSFTGRLLLANVDIPFHAPARVMVQPGGGGAGRGHDAVFTFDVDLPKVPEALLNKVSLHALDFTLDGTLSGDGGERAPVFAVGVLRLGTPDVRTPAGISPEFLRFGNARLTDVSFSETSGEASLILYNPFSFAVPIREVRYQLVVGQDVLASGVKRAVRLRPRQEMRVALPVTARNVDLASAAGSVIASGGSLDGRIVGSITVKGSTGDVVVPINLPGHVEIGR